MVPEAHEQALSELGADTAEEDTWKRRKGVEGKGQSLKFPLQGCSQGSGVRPVASPGVSGISLFS